jgi:hypothetical protein
MPLQAPPVRYELIRLSGGLDQVTPTLSLPPGVARRAANFECSINGGYSRIAGYERFDGRPSPSSALYTLLTVTFSDSVANGTTLTGVSSSATGTVIATTETEIVLTKVTGDFIGGEALFDGIANVATVTEITGVEADGLLDATYRGLAADEYRGDIGAVPGSGDVRGVAFYNGTVYAWRNNSGGTALNLYKSTSSGWTQVTFGKELGFNTGTAQISEGDTVTGATSSATGTVARVVLESGTWAGGDAAGRLILSSDSGTFQSAELLQVSASSKATCAGAATAITLSPNGRVNTVVANFGGGTANYRLYGADGVNRAFEFDGTTYVPINTGMSVDTPKHIAFHQQHLFLSFGASLQFSGLGYPYQWTPLLGAGELAMNGEITNLIPLPGDQSSGALGVYTRTDTSVLYGTSSANFALSTFNTGTGGYAYTAQNIDQAFVLDDRGIMSLGTSLNFSNFLPTSLTMNLRPFIQQRLNLAVGATVNRERGQYRVFFSDGAALYLTLVNGKVLGSMPVQFQHALTCVSGGEDLSGAVTSFFGSTNGYVYELDKGTSFDGDAIAANITLVYNPINAPRIRKRFRKASIETSGDAYAEIQFGYDLSYRSADIDQPSDANYSSDLRSGNWDTLIWDQFVWDGNDISPTEIEMTGTAENLAIRLSSISAIFKEFTVNSVLLHYTPRRGLR